MAVFKAVTALTVLLILLSESTAQLEEFEWKKLVCALFIGVKLSDGSGGLLFTGRILDILTDHSNDRNVLRNMKYYRYFPSLAAAYGVTSQGGFEKVFFNSQGKHAEKKVINQNYPPGYLKSIAINFSPCHKCVQALKDKYLRQDSNLRPVIQFSWVHNYPRSTDGYDAIRHLKEHGFNLEVWETETLIAFLLEYSPNPTLHDELLAILDSCREALLERDDATQELIKTICGVIPDSDSEDEEDDEDEQEEAYWPGWPGRSYHDSGDDDDDCGTGTGGSGTTGGGGWSRLGGLNVLGSYYGYRGSSWWRTGATAQHSSGWNHSLFDLAAFVIVSIWVMLLAVSVFLEFLNLLKV